MLRKRVLRVFPVWFLLLLLVGTGFAVLTWISNLITTFVTVSPYPITLTGAFTTPVYVDDLVYQSFDYTVNTGTPTGYIYIRFASSGIGVADIEFDSLEVDPDDLPVVDGEFVPGYPLGDLGEITWLFRNATSHSAFEFGATGGLIDVGMIYHVVADITAQIRVTSALP